MGVLAAGIRKQDELNGDTVLVQPNKKGGAVRTAAIGNNIDMLTSIQFILRYSYNFALRSLLPPPPSPHHPFLQL